MNKIEKTVIAVVVISLIYSFSVYGVWEDKVWLFAPLLLAIYTTLSAWIIVPFLKLKFSGANGKKSAFKTPLGGVPLLVFWLYSLVLIPFSVIPYDAKVSCLRFGCYIGVYWAVANIASRFPHRKRIWGVLFFSLLAVALYSLVQHKMAPDEIFGMTRYTSYWEGGRLGGTYQCPNHIAHLFLMWVPFCFLFLFLPQFSWFLRICFGYAIPVFTILIYQTQSRAGLLGLVATLMTMALLLMWRKSNRIFCIALVIVPLLGAGALGGLWAGSDMFRDRMQPVVKVASVFFSGDVEGAIDADFRPLTWADALTMVKERPLVGVGPGNYGLTFPEYRTRWVANKMLTVHPHNEPIELLVEYGLVGAGLILWGLFALILPLIQLVKTSDKPYHVFPAVAFLSALAGSAVHGFFDFELRIFPNALMLAVLGGCVVAPCLAVEKGSESPRFSTSVRWVFSIAIVCAFLLSVQVMSSALLRVRGDQLRVAKKRQAAEKLYHVSTKIDPQNWWAYLGQGQIYSFNRYHELEPDLKQQWGGREQEAFAHAYRHNIKKEEVVYGLGRAELALGHRDEGIQYLRQAAHYKRFNDFYWRKLGVELRKEGLYEEALDTFSYAKKLDHSNVTVLRNINWLEDHLGR